MSSGMQKLFKVGTYFSFPYALQPTQNVRSSLSLNIVMHTNKVAPKFLGTNFCYCRHRYANVSVYIELQYSSRRDNLPHQSYRHKVTDVSPKCQIVKGVQKYIYIHDVYIYIYIYIYSALFICLLYYYYTIIYYYYYLLIELFAPKLSQSIININQSIDQSLSLRLSLFWSHRLYTQTQFLNSFVLQIVGLLTVCIKTVTKPVVSARNKVSSFYSPNTEFYH